MLYTFAILPAPAPETAPLGIMGKPIQYLSCDRLVAAIEPDVDIEGLKLLPEQELLQAIVTHDRLVCELFSQRTLLPLRFGTAFVSIAALESYLEVEQTQLMANLERLDGYGEFLIRGTAIAPKVSTDENLKGKAYLMSKRSQYLQQEQWQGQLQGEILDYLQTLTRNLELIAPAAKLQYQIVEPQGSENLRAYLLLPRSHPLQTAMQTWQAQHPHWQIDWSQALPPYHFLP